MQFLKSLNLNYLTLKYKMCGINGITYPDESFDKNLIYSMNEALSHRGPDGVGYQHSKMIDMGHTRLGITTFQEKSGYQPMFYNKSLGACSKKYYTENIQQSPISITFNGEIYNFEKIKQTLIKKGYNFTTNSDTEVILASYQEYGENCVDHFDGMWAFTIYDTKKKILFCSRDRTGQKPFLYYHKGKKFIFSSEIQALLENPQFKDRHLNKSALYDYLINHYTSGSQTLIDGIKKLPPNSNMIIHLVSGKKEISNINEPPIKKIGGYTLKQIIKESINSLLPEREREREQSIAISLSGGLDSSIVAKEAITTRWKDSIKLFTLNWGKDGIGETEKAKDVAKYLGTTTNVISVTSDKVADILEPLQRRHYDPIAEGGLIPNEILARKLESMGFRIILTGDGADEFQGGYSRYNKAKKLINKYGDKKYKLKFFKFLAERILPISKIQQKAETVSYAQSSNLGMLLSSMKAIFSEKELKILFSKKSIEYQNSFNNKHKFLDHPIDLINEGMKIEKKALLANAFNSKEDITYSGHGIEHRAPFQSRHFIQKSEDTPGEKKQGKRLMKRIYKGKLPDKTLKGEKQGYGVPIHSWINSGLKETVINEIKDSALLSSGLMNKKLIFKYIKNMNKLYFSKKVWILYCLALYIRIHNVKV